MMSQAWETSQMTSAALAPEAASMPPGQKVLAWRAGTEKVAPARHSVPSLPGWQPALTRVRKAAISSRVMAWES